MPPAPTGLTPEQAAQVQAWIGGPGSPRAWREVYRATRDGFGAADFHRLCDGVPRLLVLIRVQGQTWLFGGFTPVGFRAGSPGCYTDPGAFLFTLVNSAGLPPTKFASKGDGHSIFSHASRSVHFGGGHDIFICDNAHTQANSSTNMNGTSYQAPPAGGPHMLSGGVKRGWLVAEVVAWAVPA